ncbi:hypothetical protein [Dinghuibacter silviterrae]|uniref:Uncharacterized protein n=1 Tax=Dinghuibacter silviterrae TaxID=1539049 RepID=A0A4R8DIT3_9BACT|nr:hypothetical protein [Dinghuibacter silviterrae]TDW97086.1 hypothetical protein EDB95_4926 [Dinghuibacter silviterrae]
MNRIFFGSAAAIMTIVGLGSFKSRERVLQTGTAWLPALENNLFTHTGSILASNPRRSQLSMYNALDPLTSEPAQGTAIGDCITNSALICVAEFNTDGSGNIVGTVIAFVTGIYQYA